jgi:hypothetical protein
LSNAAVTLCQPLIGFPAGRPSNTVFLVYENNSSSCLLKPDRVLCHIHYTGTTLTKHLRTQRSLRARTMDLRAYISSLTSRNRNGITLHSRQSSVPKVRSISIRSIVQTNHYICCMMSIKSINIHSPHMPLTRATSHQTGRCAPAASVAASQNTER